jgi:dipeptidyl aminopeptidase/acylaminoacyl peptidase
MAKQYRRHGPATTARLIIATAAAALLAPPAAGQAGLEPGRALSRYRDMDSKDLLDQVEQLQQENFATQQKVIMNQFLLQHACCTRMELVNYNSAGELVPAYVFRPAKPQPGARYPAVVMVHGGFHERLNEPWFFLINAIVERGYVVIFPEYHGSRGYGEAIYKNDYGITDTADVLAAADYIAGKPDVDPNRLGIFGISRGGMLTLLAIEQAPTRFKAAIDVVGLTDFVAYMSYKPDYRRRQIAEENPSFRGKLPQDNLEAYMKVSPINHVDAIQTPLLVMAARNDTIAPYQLHTGRLLDALKAKNKIHEAKIYDNAPGGHVFMYGDTPERADGLARTLAWLERYLGK